MALVGLWRSWRRARSAGSDSGLHEAGEQDSAVWREEWM